MKRIVRALGNRAVWIWHGVQCCYTKLFMKAPQVLSVDETLDLIINQHYSISRNGDGELNIMLGRDIPFQTYNARLASIMREAHTTQMENYMSCLPDVFNGYHNLNEKACTYYDHFLHANRYKWTKLATLPKYGNTFVSRFYIDYVDKSNSAHIIARLKQIWQGQDVLLIEGEKSRLGVGNDLFSGAKSLKRILGPAENAFTVYDALLKKIKEVAEKETLILLALGPTATAMAYELAKEGYWAVDIGHIDIEYEWFLMGATSKVNVPGKYTNESTGDKLVGALSDEVMNKYHSEIIADIL